VPRGSCGAIVAVCAVAGVTCPKSANGPPRPNVANWREILNDPLMYPSISLITPTRGVCRFGGWYGLQFSSQKIYIRTQNKRENYTPAVWLMTHGQHTYRTGIVRDREGYIRGLLGIVGGMAFKCAWRGFAYGWLWVYQSTRQSWVALKIRTTINHAPCHGGNKKATG
jgi:hypothetical protein